MSCSTCNFPVQSARELSAHIVFHVQFSCSVSTRVVSTYRVPRAISLFSQHCFHPQYRCPFSTSRRISCLVFYVQFPCSVSIRISCFVFYVQFSCSVSTRVSCQSYRVPLAMSLFNQQKDQLSVISCSTCSFPDQSTLSFICQSYLFHVQFPCSVSTRVMSRHSCSTFANNNTILPSP